jgi:Fe-S-cluster containining protein
MKQNNNLDERLVALQAGKVMEIFQQKAGAGAKALDMALSAFFFADHVVDLVEGASPLPTPIACKEGCDFCCFSQVELSPPEALFLGRFVEQHFSEAEKNELLDRIRRSLDLQAGKNKVEIAKIRENLPCPLLRDGKCTAHPARPLVCRAMHSLDAGSCEKALKTADLSSPPYYAHRQEIFFSISQGLLAGCRAVGCQSSPLELARALLDYFTRPRPVERWLQGEEAFNTNSHP